MYSYISFIIQIIIGYFIADFIIAFFHWFEDTYLDFDSNNVFIQRIAIENAMHHFYPRSIVAGNFIDDVKITFVISFIIFCVIYLLNRNFVSKYYVIFTTIFITTTLSNHLHKLTHRRDCENNAIIRFLQRYGLIMSHKEHSYHHSIDSSVKFSVINNYTNYLYDGIGIWRILEKSIELLTGIRPCHKPIVGEFYGYYDDTLLELAKSECPRSLTKKELDEIYYKILKDIYIKNGKYKQVCAKLNGKIQHPIGIP